MSSQSEKLKSLGNDFVADLYKFVETQLALEKRQVLLEVAQLACGCDTFEEFKKVLFARSLGFMKELEDQGFIKPGSTEKAAKGEELKEEDIIKKEA